MAAEMGLSNPPSLSSVPNEPDELKGKPSSMSAKLSLSGLGVAGAAMAAMAKNAAEMYETCMFVYSSDLRFEMEGKYRYSEMGKERLTLARDKGIEWLLCWGARAMECCGAQCTSSMPRALLDEDQHRWVKMTTT